MTTKSVFQILESPIFALVACLFFGVMAMSGKVSQAGANWCLAALCVVGAIGILRVVSNQPRLALGCVLILAGFCLLISHWIKPDMKAEGITGPSPAVPSAAAPTPKRPQDLNPIEHRALRELTLSLLAEWNRDHGLDPVTPPQASAEFWEWRRNETLKRMGIDIGALANGGCPEGSAFVANDNQHVTMNGNTLTGNGTATCASGSGTVEMNNNTAVRPKPKK